MAKHEPGDAIGKFMELYWNDLTPEQINYLGQSQDEVYQLEDRIISLQKLLCKLKELINIPMAQQEE